MLIDVSNPIQQTVYFSLIFVLIILMSIRLKTDQRQLSISTSNQIKGFAILSVILAHIGYYLARDHQFLFPLSVLAGVGVNLFLVFSGFGLTQSTFNKSLPIWQFYKRRLQRIYIPMWLVLTVILLAGWLVTHQTYDWVSIMQSYAGYFPRADLYHEINSPLWYFTFIALYYLIFPIVTKIPISYLWPILIWWLSTWMLTLQPNIDLRNLYQSHLLAFPLGMSLAILTNKLPRPKMHLSKWLVWSIQAVGIVILGLIIGYTAINSGVGHGIDIEQKISLLTTFSVIGLFVLLPINLGFLELYGIYSYEIYLLHWPILYRFDIFYQFLPAWLATIVYILVFLGLGYLIKKVIDRIIYYLSLLHL